MQAISASHYDPPLASGSHPDLSKLVRFKRDSGDWDYPVAIVSDDAKLTNDASYYGGMKKTDGPTLEERLQLVQQAISEGHTSLYAIEKATGLSKGKVRYIERVFHLRDQSYWVAEPYDSKAGTSIKADSVRTMSDLLGLPVVTVKQVASHGGMALGYRIRKISK